MEPTMGEANKGYFAESRREGRKSLDKFLNFIAPVFAPKMFAKEAGGMVKEKWEKSETKKNIDTFVEKTNRAADRLESWFWNTRDRVATVANEQAKRVVVLGLKPVAAGERAYQFIAADIPATVNDFKEGARSRKVDKLREALNKAETSRQQAEERAKMHRERAQKMRPVRGMIEKLQTKG